MTFNAIRWLSSHRNKAGGFVSTQDTILGLEALSTYACAVKRDQTNLTINITAADLEQEILFDDLDKMVLKEVQLPRLPTAVQLLVSGNGCVLLQGILRYNVLTMEENQAFRLRVHVDTDRDSCLHQNLQICVLYKIDSEISNMALLEIELVTGFVVVQESLDSLMKYNRSKNFKAQLSEPIRHP